MFDYVCDGEQKDSYLVVLTEQIIEFLVSYTCVISLLDLPVGDFHLNLPPFDIER